MKYIITDPCYIMDDKQYQKICDEQDCDFEGQTFPLQSTDKNSGKPIIFHKIDGTPNGDGSTEYNGRFIGVDAGMLCIAEGDWSQERYGALFETLAEAKKAFPSILRRF